MGAPPAAKPLSIPAGGFFVNWMSGGRRLVPPALSRLRARRLLERAARTGEVVHYWTHPENIASAPATLGVLRGILAEVAWPARRRPLRGADPGRLGAEGSTRPTWPPARRGDSLLAR